MLVAWQRDSAAAAGIDSDGDDDDDDDGACGSNNL